MLNQNEIYFHFSVWRRIEKLEQQIQYYATKFITSMSFECKFNERYRISVLAFIVFLFFF